MYQLSSTKLLIIWDNGFPQTSIDRAITILMVTMPEVSRHELESLSIGERNDHLLTIREKTFGAKMDCVTRCTHCSEPMEFTLDTRVLGTVETITKTEHTLKLEQTRLQFRLINSHDLKAAAQYPDLQQAAQILIERCLLSATCNGQPAALPKLTGAATAQLADELKQCDPKAELLMNLTCPACSECWQTAFDIATFLWDEIASHAKKILADVHQLALVYGWSEQDILSLNAAHRQYYLEQIA